MQMYAMNASLFKNVTLSRLDMSLLSGKSALTSLTSSKTKCRRLWMKVKDLFSDGDVGFSFHRQYLRQCKYDTEAIKDTRHLNIFLNCPFIFSSFSKLASGNLSASFPFHWDQRKQWQSLGDWLHLVVALIYVLLPHKVRNVCSNRHWQNLITCCTTVILKLAVINTGLVITVQI